MDPVNAVGIAAAVVQFADFGFRLVKSAWELYKSPSGQASEYIELSAVSQDLSSLADAVKAKLDESQGSIGEVFTRLYRECKATNDELQSILSNLRVKAGSNKIELAADGLRVAFRQVAAAGDIEKLADRLSQIRQQMDVGLLYLLLDEAGKNGVELRQFAKQQADMIATLDRIDTTTKQFSTDIIDLIDTWPVIHQTETDEMVRYVLNNKKWTSKYAKQTVFDEFRDDGKHIKLCQSLSFESISHRETSIPKRHAETFEWIFHEPRISDDGHALWSSFPQWLQTESPDIYWITGKPGAGKSTLVKFISRDPRFEALLQEWAAESQLLIITFYSWTAGVSRLQKSQEGLFRTFLFEAIQKRPQLAIDIFPARWFLLQSFGERIKLPALTMDELRTGFRNLLSATGNGLKLALLIDGLDEFDEDRHEDHRDLIHLLREANAETGVKVCASSRPWNIFRDEYGQNPMLQLENLTQEDIKSFVQEQLQLSPGYRDFADTNQQAASKIITDIVDKSQGVFLWVSVISRLLLNALRDGTAILELQATIDNVPGEVADLFRYIWNRTSNRFRAEASQYFRLMKLCQEYGIHLFALTLWFGDAQFPVDFDAACVTSTYLTGAVKTLERKVMSRTGGLLELVCDNDDHIKPPRDVRVDYMHRTANDWVNDNWASITSVADPGFDPYFWFVKGQSLSAVFTTKPNESNVKFLARWKIVFTIASLVSETHPDMGTLVTALDRLDQHLASHTHVYQGGGYHKVHRGILSSVSDTRYVRVDLMQEMGIPELGCASFLEFAARVPIPAYLKYKTQENPLVFSAEGNDYERILDNVIFGEIWFNNPQTRLEILDFLIQEKYCRSLELLCKAKDKARYSAIRAPGTISDEHPLYVHFMRAHNLLESRISQAAGLASRDGVAVGGRRHKMLRPRMRNGLRVFFKETFGQKQS
ncbi:hypothetical protein M431DRAFT_502264 [Trichoderma harzianum CBS 226.95]|uniref:NACHT domain-containing protein n=1 Tax=Trichoderma harzianum CBS 226.95 TaxID=983964 RepID=A0A2T4ASV5_TRIHA|nr:hypothetical protein M431DRAFT_502264 [Trichoderma harzianum CBS 226.95]PTB60142.1 hypothetical protein M431DRAFT_502264 [Trichoderma harzianum CBS 226.95]